MGIVNLVLIALGVVSMAFGYSRARGPWRALPGAQGPGGEHRPLRIVAGRAPRHRPDRGLGGDGAGAQAGARRRNHHGRRVRDHDRRLPRRPVSDPREVTSARAADARPRLRDAGDPRRRAPRSRDARPQHADLRDGDVRVRLRGGEGGRGRPGDGVGPDRVLLLADRQPDDPRAGGEARLPRRRGGRGRGLVGDGLRVVDAARPPRAAATTSSSATSCSSSPGCCSRTTSLGAASGSRRST